MRNIDKGISRAAENAVKFSLDGAKTTKLQGPHNGDIKGCLMLHTVCDCKSKGNNTIKTLNIPLKIRLHGNSCVFDTQSWKPVQKPNSEKI